MKYPVLRKFRDKYTKRIHEKGATYEANEERGAELQRLGFLGEPLPEPSEEPELKHVGGGYYELPNGERVRGKDAALAALRGESDAETAESE